jgi:hypothetical protein
MTIRQTAPTTQETNSGSDRVTLSSFTGAKLDWLKCVAFDRRLKPYDFKVAFVIAQHLNLNTGSTMLSDGTIADESAIGPRHVRRARERLHNAGWLTWHHTQTANVYRLDHDKVSYTLDAITLSREARAERHRRWKPAALSRTQPWKAEGVSRPTWYRRQRRETAQADSGGTMRRLRRTPESAETGLRSPPYTLEDTLKEER